MKISLNWLQDFITLTTKDPQEIARRVTAGVAEVDEVEILGGLLGNTCVGKILSVKKHPQADRLVICEVQTDKGKKMVVCGGTNLREGMRVAFAHVGAKVRWHGDELTTLERAKIRGIDSEGMICAAEELDLQTKFPPKPQDGERPIVNLGEGEEGVGRSLKEYLGLDDVVLHIDNHAITHRADLFSHIGFAREFVALGLGKWKGRRGETLSRPLKFPKDKLPLKCIVDCKDLVPRYVSCLLNIEGIGETPAWMRKRLEVTGWRSVSLPVDITNYVAMETGMPLHSFDADDIRGGEFSVRTAKEGETITTLDGVDRALPKGAIVLSDREGIFDLLGIMGGLRSSTKDTTKHIYLHAAIVDPASIRKAIIATGHRTDASTVYEKGVPRIAAMQGLLRAAELFTDLVPGARIASTLEEWGDEGKAKPITLPIEQVSRVLGADIPEKRIMKILSDLEFTAKKKGKALTVTPPLHRLGDIRASHDLVEEIGRIAGYNEIPDQLPAASIRPPKREMRVHQLRTALKGERFTELLPLSLTGADVLKKAGIDPSVAVSIANPLGEDLQFLLPETLPPLLEHAQRNILHAGEWLKTFTISHVFKKGQEAPLRSTASSFEGQERMQLGMLSARLYDAPPERALLHDPFLNLAQNLNLSLEEIGYEMERVAAGSMGASAHPGRFAEVFIRPKPQAGSGAETSPWTKVGTMFEVHPSVRSAFDLPHRAAAALIDLTTLLALPPAVTVPAPVAQFPAVTYDVTLPFRMSEQAGELLKRLRGSHELLENVSVKDLYAVKQSKEEYQLTITFTYRAKDRTLTEEEAKQVHGKVLQLAGDR